MRKQLGFLKISSLVVKIFSWIFLFFGVLAGLNVIFSPAPGSSRWVGPIILVLYLFFFFLLFLIAKIVDLLVGIISAAGGSALGGNDIKKE